MSGWSRRFPTDAKLDGMRRLLADLGEPNVDAAALINALQQAGWTPPGAVAAAEPPRQARGMTAIDFLQCAANEMHARAALRDSPQGERSVAAAVQAFNVLFGHQVAARIREGKPPLSETHGWELQSLLKKSRSANGAYHEDDYVDGVAYASLTAESAARELGGTE
ncbi:MAG: hypothetical protein JJU06_05955 [Ectothiorhodospiraceae bacterium]|nr:hypothetical protein [Ectothiorhodospiraceae bacterium]